MLEQIRDYYRIGLTWTSNALEGNTLTESETKVLLEDGLTVVPGHQGNRYRLPLSDRRTGKTGQGDALIQDGYLPVIIPPVLRMEYISLLERAHEDDAPFVDFIAERELESQKEILRLFQIPFPQIKPEQGGMELQ